MKRNKSIVSKVYLPKHTLIMSDMMVNAFKMLICFGLSAGMIIYYRVPIGWQALYAIPALITMIIFTFGCCCILLHLGVFIDDMANVINIVLRFVFYLTGIFYNINIFPEPIYSLVLKGIYDFKFQRFYPVSDSTFEKMVVILVCHFSGTGCIWCAEHL